MTTPPLWPDPLAPRPARRRRSPRRRPQPAARPPWCGQCDERTRLVERPGDGVPYRCPSCHPTTADHSPQAPVTTKGPAVSRKNPTRPEHAPIGLRDLRNALTTKTGPRPLGQPARRPTSSTATGTSLAAIDGLLRERSRQRPLPPVPALHQLARARLSREPAAG